MLSMIIIILGMIGGLIILSVLVLIFTSIIMSSIIAYNEGWKMINRNREGTDANTD